MFCTSEHVAGVKVNSPSGVQLGGTDRGLESSMLSKQMSKTTNSNKIEESFLHLRVCYTVL